MNTLVKYSALSIALMATSTLALASTANAQQRGRQVTVQGSGGKSATATTQKGVQNGSYYKNKSVQTGSGKGYTKSKSGGYDETTGKYYRDSSVTTNGGKTVSKSTQGGCENGVCQNSKTYEGPNGGSAGSETYRYIDESGNYVKDKTYTGVNGNSVGKDVVRDGEGQKTTTTTGPKGETRQRTRWISVD